MPAACCVVFDMDGLMFNTEDIYTMVGTELLRRRGREFADELKGAIMGLTPRATFELMIGQHKLEEKWEDLEAESNGLFLGLLDEHLVELPGLEKLLDALEAAGIPKAIATGSGRSLAEVCLSRFDLARRFTFILTAGDITHSKPHPEIYLAAAERFGLPPREMLVLEDSENGCRAATAAGAFTVAVPGQHSREHDFSAASLVVDDLTDRRLYQVLGLHV